jgi:hypothetical protein
VISAKEVVVMRKCRCSEAQFIGGCNQDGAACFDIYVQLFKMQGQAKTYQQVLFNIIINGAA